MKKLFLFAILVGFVLIFGFRTGQSVFASSTGQGYINIFGYSNDKQLYKNPCDPATTDCSADHPFAKNCNTQTMTCDGSNSSDIPGKKRWVFKWKCLDKNQKCADQLVGGPVQGPLTIDKNLACGISEQLDVFDKNCMAAGPNTWDPNCGQTADYLTYYSGDCPAATPSAAPTASPSATPAPAPGCNVQCNNQAANFCQQASDGCTTCDSNSGTCQNPNNLNNNPGGSPAPSNPPVTQAPTVSPTPGFTPDMCQCDGITNTPIVAGQSTTFTAYGKVSSANSNTAMVKDITFTFAKGNEFNTNVVAKSGPLPATVDTSNTDASKVRYTASWTQPLPANLDTSATYSVWYNLDCVQNGSAYNTQAQPQNEVVLGASTKAVPVKTGILDQILQFFARLFGQQPQVQKTALPQNVTPVMSTKPTSSSVGVQSTNGTNNQLQMGSFNPGQVIERKACLLKFKFQQ